MLVNKKIGKALEGISCDLSHIFLGWENHEYSQFE